MLREIGLLLHPTLLGILVFCCIFIISFTAHFQSLAAGNGFGSQVPFSFTITVTLLTILAASIEGFSLFLEVIKSPVAKVQYPNLLSALGRARSTKLRADLVFFPLQDIDTAIAIGEPYVEGALGLLWLAVLIVGLGLIKPL
ncbi:hypothetical protein FRC00_002873 [Tulasnella sp. 408]|nr:hypothetical protein FRC00_002873 [Tulasnella sp. 408]